LVYLILEDAMANDRHDAGVPGALAPRVCVIGAGMSGLAATDALVRAGYDVSCYEAGSAVGGMWRYENDSGRSAAYASLQTNTSRRRMQYPSFPQPRAAPEFPHHRDMLAYLEAYSDANHLARYVNFGASVESARPDDGCWDVTVAGDAPRRFDWLVVASGHYWDPVIPRLGGDFAGEILHVRDYRTPDRFAGRRVVVVGGSQSALDVVAEISTVAARAVLACDQVHHLLPRYAFGRPLDERDTAAALLVPLPIVRLIIGTLTRLAGATPERGELPPARHRLFETRWPTIVSPAVEAALAERTFKTRPRATALAAEKVIFGDGSEEPADAIVFATGYRIAFPFLSDRLGRGSGWEFPLYRRILSPRAPALAFIGVVEAGPGMFEIVERQSQWLAKAIAGRVPVPASDAMWRAIDAGERRSRRQFAATGRHTIMCNRHAYLRVLAADVRRGERKLSQMGSQHGEATSARARPRARPLRGRRLPAAGASARLQAQMLRKTAEHMTRARATGTLEDLARDRHALIVTYRGDGTPVATPVWAAVAAGRVYVRTERASGKVKRLSRDSRALAAPCTSRGRPLGPPLSMHGRVLDSREETVAEPALAGRYGPVRALFERAMDIMRVDMCYLELTPEHAAPVASPQ
jgi:PPOX class probable F420-dependent enzyme